MCDGRFNDALLTMLAVYPQFCFIEGSFSARVAAIDPALVKQDAITFESEFFY